MKTEDALKGAIGFFVLILAGSLLSSVLGGVFGAVVATISPEFVKSLFNPDAGDALIRYSMAIGMIWGLFMGAAVSGFACFLAAFIKILRIHFEFKKAKEANNASEGNSP